MNTQVVSKLLSRFRHTDLDVVLDNWKALQSRNIRSQFKCIEGVKRIAMKKKFIKTFFELTEVKYSPIGVLIFLHSNSSSDKLHRQFTIHPTALFSPNVIAVQWHKPVRKLGGQFQREAPKFF